MPDLNEQVVKYLTDAHGLEEQSLRSLQASAKASNIPELTALFEQHEQETRVQQERLSTRLAELGADPSTAKQAGNAVLAAARGAVDGVRPENAGKTLRDAYVGESLEVVSYELLKRVAHRAGDEQTESLADQHLAEERATIERLEGLFDRGVEASLKEEGALA